MPDLLTELMVKPPERLKSSALAPPLMIVTCWMSWEERSGGLDSQREAAGQEHGQKGPGEPEPRQYRIWQWNQP